MPIRQLVLTMPFPPRFPLAFDGKLLGQVLRIFTDTARAAPGAPTAGERARETGRSAPPDPAPPPAARWGSSRSAAKVTNEQLITLAAAGNKPAFAVLVTRYLPRIAQFCTRFVGDMSVAQELAQENFLEVRRPAGHAPSVVPWSPTLWISRGRAPSRRG